MTEAEYKSRLDQALEEEHKDFFTASDIAGRLEGASSKRLSSFLHKISDSEGYNIQKLGGSPNIFSSVGKVDISTEFFRDHRENYQKAIQVVNEVEEVPKVEVLELLDEYVESEQPSSEVEHMGRISDNLRKHPQISYDEEEERYIWNE
jgi:hypothetical protein